MILTKRQREELQRLSLAPRPTYGAGRARVQNTLVRYGLAGYHSRRGSFSECRITERGREVNAEASRRTERPSKEPTR